MIKAEKKTLKLSVEKPQYITVNDITYAQVDSWFGHCRRDLKLDIIYPEWEYILVIDGVHDGVGIGCCGKADCFGIRCQLIAFIAEGAL